MSHVICDYCKQPTQLVTGAVIYPAYPDLKDKLIYSCEPCGAYVGCHPNTEIPLGRLANKELRTAKMKAHAAFDPLWKSYKKMKRGEAYKWLANSLGLRYAECHIGMFDVDMCKRVCEAVKSYWEENRKKYQANL
jgi:hypothetical protein